MLGSELVARWGMVSRRSSVVMFRRRPSCHPPRQGQRGRRERTQCGDGHSSLIWRDCRAGSEVNHRQNQSSYAEDRRAAEGRRRGSLDLHQAHLLALGHSTEQAEHIRRRAQAALGTSHSTAASAPTSASSPRSRREVPFGRSTSCRELVNPCTPHRRVRHTGQHSKRAHRDCTRAERT